MRITTSMMYDRSIGSMMKTSERLNKASQQFDTGDRFTTAGEDPTAMAQKLNLTTEIARYKQYSSNGTSLQASLTLEETTLDSLYTAMNSAYSKVQQAINGTNDASERNALASELTELQKQMVDLMNTKDASGQYIFSGNQTQTQPFVLDGNGQYQYAGDAGQRSIQVSPTITIAANDSGLELFQSVATQRTATSGSAALSVNISSQGQFDNFYSGKYDPVTAANNVYTVTTIAGTPDQYEVRDASNVVLQSGDYTQGSDISFNGLTLNLNVATGGSANFSLDAPTNDNILNSLSAMITALKDPSVSSSQLKTMATKTEHHLTNAQESVNATLGRIGGRLNNLDSVLASNETLASLSKVTRADVSEIDLYEAATNVTKENNALARAQQSYSMISKTTLFDYL